MFSQNSFPNIIPRSYPMLCFDSSEETKKYYWLSCQNICAKRNYLVDNELISIFSSTPLPKQMDWKFTVFMKNTSFNQTKGKDKEDQVVKSPVITIGIISKEYIGLSPLDQVRNSYSICCRGNEIYAKNGEIIFNNECNVKFGDTVNVGFSIVDNTLSFELNDIALMCSITMPKLTVPYYAFCQTWSEGDELTFRRANYTTMR
jgi:hypothetical protein